MTVENRSFEHPTGTPPSVESSNVEPFALIDGTFLDVAIVGAGGVSGIYRWEVDAADFSSVGAATAAEIAAAIDGSNEGFTASASAGRVTLEGLYNGSTLQVLGGQPQLALQWSTDLQEGTAIYGPGQDWTYTVVGTYLEWAGFGSSPELPLESFETSWGHVASATFSGTFTEDFELGWNLVSVGGALESALFGGSLTTEGFETDWDVLSVTSTYTAATFDAALDAFEDFEEEWDFTGATASYDVATFADGLLTYEPFEPVTTTTHVVTVTTPADGFWEIEINGEVFPYESTGGESIADICIGLAGVAGGSAVATAASFPTTVNIAPVDGRDTLSVSARAPSGGAVNTQLATESTTFVASWVGQDINPLEQ